MEFVRVDAALAECHRHLDETGTRNSQIESYLVSYLVTVIHAEFEQGIQLIMKRRTTVQADDHLSAWGEYTVGRLARKVSIGDLAGLLRAFDESCKEHFSSAVVDTQHHVAYDNIETNRQAVAHSVGTSMTLAELEDAYANACHVLDAFEAALSAPAPRDEAVAANPI